MAYSQPVTDDQRDPEYYADETIRREFDDFPEITPNSNPGIAGPTGATKPAARQPYNMDAFVEGWRDSVYDPTAEGFRSYMESSPYGSYIQYAGKDKFVGPDGRVHDIIGKFGTAEATKRTGRTTDPRYASVTGATANRAARPVSPGQGVATVNPAAMPAPAQGQYDDAVYKHIMGLLDRGSQPVSADDPAIRDQFAPISAVMQRGAERAKFNAASRASFQGTNFGGAGGPLDAENRGIDEDLALGQGQEMGKLIGSELAARRQDIVNGLAFATGEQKLQLTQRLAEVDQEIRKMQLAQQESQFSRGLAQSGRQFDANLGFQYAGLGQQNQQFYDQYDRDNAIWEYLKSEGYFQDL